MSSDSQPSESLVEEKSMIGVEESGQQSRAASPTEVTSTSSESPADPSEEASTPPTPRRLRSSGVVPEEKTDETGTRRSVRKPAEQRFLQTDSNGRNKRPQDQPGVGEAFQADIPDFVESRDFSADTDREQVFWLPEPSFEYSDGVKRYIELARTLRTVDADVVSSGGIRTRLQALNHMFTREYSLAKALEDFEALPIPRYIWTAEQTHDLVKKLSQGRKVVSVQKYFAEKYNFPDARARVVEKRFELLHRLCLGESRWLCPQMMERECENCLRWLHLLTPDEDPAGNYMLCNVCSLYAELFRRFRVFSVRIDDDAYIQKGLDQPQQYNDQDEHFDCFTEKILSNVRQTIEWTTAEHMICVRGFRELGQNFDEIASRLESRTGDDVEAFYVQFKQRYNLDELISHFDREQETPAGQRTRRVADDRTPTPANDDSGEEDMDDSSNVRVSMRNAAPRSSITTRNKARTAVEGVA